MMRTLNCCLIAIIITTLSSYVAPRRGVSVPNFSIRPPLLNRGRIHYKTTYACEGNSLHLTCEEGRNIHLVRANYGRFSISICNDGGKLDLSVNCMSYRSFLIMQDRCSQKSNCSVVVSSKMFGDPCPGTLKYLEVQYHCVHGGASASASASTTRRPPIMLNIPLLAGSSNNSSLYPPIQPSTISSNEDVIAIITEASVVSPSKEVNVAIMPSSPSSTTNYASSTIDTMLNHIEKVESAELQPPSNSMDNSMSKTNNSKLPSHSFNPEDDLNSFLPKFPPPPPPVPSYLPSLNPPIDLRTEYCPPIFVRSLFWNWTKQGESAIQKCPGGATGSVRWDCKAHQLSGFVDWVPERPDFSECRSLWLDNLKDRLYNGDPVIRIANELALMTLTKALFSEDLKQIAFIVQETLARAIVSLENLQSVEVWHRHQVLKELLMFIVETVSNLLDNAQDDAWLDLSLADRKRVASKLLEGLEESALLLADNTNQDGSFAVAKPNVLVSVHVLDTRMPISLQFPTIEDTRGTNEWQRMEDSILLPAQALLEYSTNGLAKAAFLAYYRIEDLLKPDIYTMHGGDEANRMYLMANKLHNLTSGSLAINSRVIGASIGSIRSGENNVVLSHPVTIVLRHIQEENISSPRCVYWDSEKLDWLKDGCWIESTNATHTTCMCNHLTHFALLMDIKPIEALPISTNWQKLVAIIGCIITVLCLVFITVILMVVSAGNTEAISIHRNLCITLLITEFTFLFGIYKTDLPVVCSFTAGILHFFLLSAFLWTFLESFDLYYNLIDVYETVKSSRRLMWYYIIAYGGPIIIILISICIDPSSYGTTNYCWLRMDNYFYFSFVGPAIGIIFGAFVFVTIAYFILFNNSNINTSIKGIEEVKLDMNKSSFKWVTALLILQCTTWTFGLIHVNLQTSTSTALTFAILNIILGIFIVLFCTIKIDNIQHLKLIKSLPWMSYCFEDINCVPSKANVVVHGDPYQSRPVVTQVTPTQVSGFVSPNIHSPSSQQIGNIGSSPTPSSQITSSHHQQWNLPQEKNNCSTIQDHRSILAQQERSNILMNSKGGTTGPIMVNPINDTSVPTLNVAIGDITAAALESQNLADYESRLQQIRINSMSRVPKIKRKMRHHGAHFDDGTRYGIHSGLHGHVHPHLYNQCIEHIYETIDSDSMGSGAVYDQHERHVHRSPADLSQINDFYAGANVTINPTNIADDEWSQNSSSSYGPLYDDRPLLAASFLANCNPNLNHLLISNGQRIRHHHSNSNIYHSSAPISYRTTLKIRNTESSNNPNETQVISINNESLKFNDQETDKKLPDLVQYPFDNNTTVHLNHNSELNKSLKDSRKEETHLLASVTHHPKLSTYC